MKVLTTLLAFNSINNEYLFRVLENYKLLCELGFAVTAIIHTADVWTDGELQTLQQNFICQNSFIINIEVYNKDIKLSLANQHRYNVIKEQDNYNLFIYQEDDMNLTPYHILSYLNHSTFFENSASVNHSYTSDNSSDIILPQLGFLRYELFDEPGVDSSTLTITETAVDGTVSMSSQQKQLKYLCDMPTQRFSLTCIDDVPFLVDEYNPHQALWILTQKQLKQLDKSCNFLSQQDLILDEYRGTRVYMSSFSVSTVLLTYIFTVHSCYYYKIVTLYHIRCRYIRLILVFFAVAVSSLVSPAMCLSCCLGTTSSHTGYACRV